VKAYTYLGSALLHLNRPDESFKASHKAYQLAIEQRSPSIPQIAATCLEAKKKRWELAESERIKRESMLLRDTMAMIERDALERARRVGEEQGQEIMEEAAQKCRHLEEVFGKAEAETLRKRTVPDWLIDNITFGVMWDPVIVGPPCTLVGIDADLFARDRPKTGIPMIAQH
jgi:STIP1 family protein 1